MKLKELYYCIKSRVKNGNNACAIGIIHSDGKKKRKYDEKLDSIAQNTLPCRKTNDEVLDYIRNKYELKIKSFTDSELEMYKINFLLGKHPEFINVQEKKENLFNKAKNFPMEKLGLKVEGYTFDYILEDGFTVTFEVTAENKYDNISVGFRVINRNLSQAEEKTLRSISDEIIIFKGVTKEDIKNRTVDFMIYADAVMNR